MSKIVINQDDIRNDDGIYQERQVPKENKYIGSQILKRGHRMYKYHEGVVSELTDSDYYGAELKVAERLEVYFKPIDVRTGKEVQIGNFHKQKKNEPEKEPDYHVVKKIRIEPNTYYRGALNIKNAVKQFQKLGLTVRIIERF